MAKTTAEGRQAREPFNSCRSGHKAPRRPVHRKLQGRGCAPSSVFLTDGYICTGSLKGFSPASETRRLAEALCSNASVQILIPKYPRAESSSVARQQLTRGAPMVWHRMTPAIRDGVGHMMTFEAQAEKRRQARRESMLWIRLERPVYGGVRWRIR